MAEDLILTVSDRQNAIHKALFLVNDRPKRKGVDSGAAGLFLQKCGASCVSHIDRHIIVIVHLLQISADTHDQKALQRDMLLLAEAHKPLGRLLFQMENIESGIYLRSSGKCRPGSREFLPRFLQLSRSLDAIKDRL